MMTFEFEQYRLRKPKPEDAMGFFTISQDKEVMEFYGAPRLITTLEDAHRQVEWCLGEFGRNAGRWIITEKERDVYIGDVGFSDFVEPHNRIELGYRLCRAYWGRGIITNFIRQLVEWGFRDLGYNRIEAMVDPRNEGSRIVLLRNGFQCEGTLRDYEFEHGHFVDLEMYSLLRKDYIP
jgi:ribosomal-protein-alanine N-acetyltransferase